MTADVADGQGCGAAVLQTGQPRKMCLIRLREATHFALWEPTSFSSIPPAEDVGKAAQQPL